MKTNHLSTRVVQGRFSGKWSGEIADLDKAVGITLSHNKDKKKAGAEAAQLLRRLADQLDDPDESNPDV